jgi:hypothetical protein
MTNDDTRNLMIDLYAAGELPIELETELKAKALADPRLAEEMESLAAVVKALGELPKPEFTEETSERILTKMLFAGADLTRRKPQTSHLQYQLPMSG